MGFLFLDSQPAPKKRKRGPRAKRSRNWAFTDFGDDDEDPDYTQYEDLQSNVANGIRFVIAGKETCPDTGKIHVQGYAQFSSPISLSTAQRILNLPNRHFEVCKGTSEENEKYCSKDGDFVAFGTYIQMGQRTDVDEIRVMLNDNVSMLKIAEANFPLYLRSYRAFATYQNLVQQEQRSEFRHVRTIILAGRTGCGKTRSAMSLSPYKIQGSTRALTWFDGYGGEDTLLIDEFDSCSVPIEQMLSLLDGHPTRLPIKGGFTYANWTKVIITTNQISPLYNAAAPELLAAFDRRIFQRFSKFTDEDPELPVMPDFSDIE